MAFIPPPSQFHWFRLLSSTWYTFFFVATRFESRYWIHNSSGGHVPAIEVFSHDGGLRKTFTIIMLVVISYELSESGIPRSRDWIRRLRVKVLTVSSRYEGGSASGDQQEYVNLRWRATHPTAHPCSCAALPLAEELGRSAMIRGLKVASGSSWLISLWLVDMSLRR